MSLSTFIGACGSHDLRKKISTGKTLSWEFGPGGAGVDAEPWRWMLSWNQHLFTHQENHPLIKSPSLKTGDPHLPLNPLELGPGSRWLSHYLCEIADSAWSGWTRAIYAQGDPGKFKSAPQKQERFSDWSLCFIIPLVSAFSFSSFFFFLTSLCASVLRIPFI